MQQRHLGKNGPLVSANGPGLHGDVGFYGTRDDEESIATIHRSIELGITFLDTRTSTVTATMKILVGMAIGRGAPEFSRHQIRNGSGQGQSRCARRQRRPEYVRESCDASLKRLGVERIDLYYQHRVDPVSNRRNGGAMGSW